MKLSECPQCEKPILIPGSQMSVDAKCPLCEKEFSLNGISCEEIPVVELIRSNELSERGHETVTETLVSGRNEARGVTEIEIPSDALFKDDDELRLEEVETSHEVSGNLFDVPSPFDKNSTTNSQLSTSTGRRKARRNKSAIWEATKIFLGGTAGVIIAQLILWWLPGDLKRDPLDIAENLPNRLRFLVPRDLWEATHRVEAGAGSDRPDQVPTNPSKIRPPAISADAPNDVAEKEKAVSDENTTMESPTDQSFLDGPDGSDQSNSTPESTAIQIRNAPTISVADFDTAYHRARAANSATGDSVSTSDSKSQRKFYLRLSELARAATYLDRDSIAAIQRLDDAEGLLGEIANVGFKTDVVGVGAAGWISYRRRTTTGIAFAGRVTEIERRGNVYAARISLKGRPKSLATMILPGSPTEDPRTPFDVGDSVFGLGAIIEQPGTQIPTYEGSEDNVIWSGLHVVLRK